MINDVPIEKCLLMKLLNCDANKLEIILRLFKKFKKSYGKNIMSKVIRDLERDYEADYVISGIIIEALELVNKTYSINVEYLSLGHTKSGYTFDLEYLEEYLNDQDFDELTREKIKTELISWHVVF